jgi:hypothetical protein
MTSVEFVYIFGLGGNRIRSFGKLIISKIKKKKKHYLPKFLLL